MAFQNLVSQLTTFINFKNSGWSEKCFFKDQDLLLAQTKAAKYLKYRVACLGDECEIVYARVSFPGKPREALPVTDYPRTANAQLGITLDKISDPEVCLHFRFTAWDGTSLTVQGTPRSRSVHWRGCQDLSVTNFRYAAGNFLGTFDFTNLPAAPAAADADEDRWRKLVRAFGNLTVSAVKKTVSGTPGWDVMPWQQQTFREISDHQTGRPFGLFRGRALTGK